MNAFGTLASLALLLTLAGPALAEPEITIGGDNKISVETGDNIAIGIGKDVSVAQDIGSVHGTVHIGGDNTINVETGDNIAIGIGDGVSVSQSIGSVSSH